MVGVEVNRGEGLFRADSRRQNVPRHRKSMQSTLWEIIAKKGMEACAANKQTLTKPRSPLGKSVNQISFPES